MIYFLLGDNAAAKEAKISEIRTKALASLDAVSFDLESLQANKLDPAQLKKSLLNLPVIASQRVVLVRGCDKLSNHHQEIIFEFAKSKANNCELVLDFENEEGKAAFVEKLTPFAKVQTFSSGKKQNAFDMTRAMTSRNPVEALKILSELLKEGQHPLQVMGALVWYWGQAKEKLAPDRFRKGLKVLQQTDFNIKRSRLEPGHAVEMAVVKLSSLIAY